MKLVVKQAAGTTITIEVRCRVIFFRTHHHSSLLPVSRMEER